VRAIGEVDQSALDSNHSNPKHLQRAPDVRVAPVVAQPPIEDPELAVVVGAWEKMSPALRSAILILVSANDRWLARTGLELPRPSQPPTPRES